MQRQDERQLGLPQRADELGMFAVQAVRHDRAEAEAHRQRRVDQLDRDLRLGPERGLGLALGQAAGRGVGLQM